MITQNIVIPNGTFSDDLTEKDYAQLLIGIMKTPANGAFFGGHMGGLMRVIEAAELATENDHPRIVLREVDYREIVMPRVIAYPFPVVCEDLANFVAAIEDAANVVALPTPTKETNA